MLGCKAMVSSNACLVRPAFTAIAAACKISALSGTAAVLSGVGTLVYQEQNHLVGGGDVVVNPHGGLLSLGYIHGLNHHYEAALKLRHAAGVRQVDHVARWGGEEFLILLPGTEVPEAMAVAERLRAGVQQLRVAGANGQPLTLAMTVGVSVLEAGGAFDQALARADRALYAGKQAGRNRVVLASPPES